MSLPHDATFASSNDDRLPNRLLSQFFRNAQLAGDPMSLSRRADIARRFDAPAYVYRERGEYGLRRW